MPNTNPEQQNTALCAELDLATVDRNFFGDGIGNGGETYGLRAHNREEATKAAIQICRKCPVIRECLKYALENPEDTEYGVWGGLSELERRAIRRRGGMAIRRALESVTSEKTSS